jgi:hypothetical protein
MSLDERMNDIFDEVANKVQDMRDDLMTILNRLDAAIAKVEKHPLEKTKWGDLRSFINEAKIVSSSLADYLDECECEGEDCEVK